MTRVTRHAGFHLSVIAIRVSGYKNNVDVDVHDVYLKVTRVTLNVTYKFHQLHVGICHNCVKLRRMPIGDLVH